MPDNVTINAGTPIVVAFHLYQDVLGAAGYPDNVTERLKLYQRCLHTVLDQRVTE